MKAWFALLALLLVSACARAPLEPRADRAARDFYAAVEAGDWARVEAALAPELARTAQGRAGFQRLRAALPRGGAREARAVGWSRAGEGGLQAVHLYRFAHSDVVVRTTLRPHGGNLRVASFVAQRQPLGQVEANRFTFAGKTPRHYSFLATALLSPLIMVAVAAMAAMARGLRFKLAWMALALVGVGEAWFNWTTGEGGFSFAALSLVNVGFGRDTDISPWLIRFSLPAGALLVLARLATLKERRLA
ncbi:hypothetical protein [Phenylobacterium sp.]|jgi:hypothetical protein|uniref:hypothetical protein n=1 Tax=Phenylobacterium sp. TaxID=1871053 RepID=UPI002F95714E